MSRSTNELGAELGVSRYVLDVPSGVYPLNGDDPKATPHGTSGRKEYKYPDFERWVYKEEQDTIMQNYLQKGYYDPPFVGNELLSARSAVHHLLHSEDKNSMSPTTGNKQPQSHPKLDVLSDTVVKAIDYRRKANKLSMKSTYKPPPRVTLTENKKEIWLKNLANPDIPLSRLSRTIPHGIRNKVLLDQCCTKQIPITRALWFVKCVGTNELRGLKRKNAPMMMNSNNSGHGKLFEQNWLHDWTVQVTEYIEKLSRDCFIYTDKEAQYIWRQNLNYIVKFVSHLFMSQLINNEVFLGWIVRFLKKISIDSRDSSQDSTTSSGDFKLVAVHLIFLKLFWFRIIKIDYLSKELSVTLLLIYSKLQDGKSLTKDLNVKLSRSFKYLITYLFYYKSSSFIMSDHWTSLKPILRRVIDTSDPVILQQFDLITYRNESLLMSLSDSDLNLSSESLLIKKLDLFKLNLNLDSLIDFIFEESNEISKNNVTQSDPKASRWKQNLIIVFNWCISSFRKDSDLQVQLTICIVKNYLKKCSQKSSKASKRGKQDVETLILDYLYAINDKHSQALFEKQRQIPIDINKFIICVNELYTMKLFTMSSYLRRLISSGIIYLPNAESKTLFHILIIKNLPIFGNAQCLSILKTLSGQSNYQEFVEQEYQKSKTMINSGLDILFSKDSVQSLENNIEFWNKLQSFDTGIKFLAVEYLVTEFKLRVSSSLKMVTFDNERLSLFYKMFSHLQSKSRFFEDFLITILLNSNSMINWYLDTLYFLCHILIANYSFTLCLSSSSQPDSSYLSDVLKLVMTLYVSLRNISDEDVAIDFTNVWEFFITKIDDSNTALVADLKSLTGVKLIPSTKTQEHVEENLKVLGLPITYEQFNNSDRLRANELKLLERYLAIIKAEVNGGEDVDRTLEKRISQLLHRLKWNNGTEFVDYIVEFCNLSLLPSLYLDFDSYLKISMKLIIEQLIGVSDLIEVFSKESSISDNITGNVNHRLIWCMLFDNKNTNGLSSYELLKFRLIRAEYTEKNEGRILDFIKIGIMDAQASFSLTTSPENPSSVIENQFNVQNDDHLPTPISNSVATPLPIMGESVPGKNLFINLFEEQLSTIFNQAAFSNIHLLTEKITSTDLNRDVLLEIFNGLVLLDYKDIFSSKDIGKLIEIVGAYNLPLCQTILTVVWENEFGADKSEEFKNVTIQDHLMSLFMNLITYKKKTGIDKSEYFNQLFNLINSELKLIVLDSCKTFFLRSEHFPQVYVTSSEDSLVPVLNEIINNCLRTMKDETNDMMILNDSLVFSLNTALEKLVYVSNKNFSTSSSTDPNLERADLSLSIGLTLKIILIHKQFLVEMILKRSNDVSNDSFIQNLARLYNSKIVRHDSKLKNYFYDSLLSIEVLITESIDQQMISSQNPQQPSQRPQQGGTAAITSNIFKLPPLNTENVLSLYVAKLNFSDGLVDLKNVKKLSLTNEREDFVQEFTVRPFDLIEEANPVPSINNTSISLQLFNATTERKNPP